MDAVWFKLAKTFLYGLAVALGQIAGLNLLLEWFR